MEPHHHLRPLPSTTAGLRSTFDRLPYGCLLFMYRLDNVNDDRREQPVRRHCYCPLRIHTPYRFRMVSSGVEMKTLPVKHKAQTLRTPTAHAARSRPSQRGCGGPRGEGAYSSRVPVSTRSISFTNTPSLHIRYYNNRLSIKSANAKLFSVLSPIGSVIKSRSPDCASRSGRSERRSRRDRGHRPRPSARHGPRLRAAVREDAPVGRGC